MKGKNLTRILSTLLMTVILFTLLFSHSVFAEEPDEADLISESEGEAALGATGEKNNETVEKDNGRSSDAEVSIFEKAYEGLLAKAPEITSLLAFIGSLIIILSYKNGFLPLVSDGIKALASGVKSISEKTDALEYGSEEFKNKIAEKIEKSEILLAKIEGSLEDLEARLSSRESEQKERAELKRVLLAETEMLYEVFMSAALPQYLKDSVGEKMAAIRRSAEETYGDEK